MNIVTINQSTIIPQRATVIAKQIAGNNYYGYNNGKNGRGGKPDYACSSFVADCYIRAGLDLGIAAKDVYTKDMKKIFTSHGFKDVFSSVNVKTGSGLQTGDILLKPGSHTEIYSGNKKVVGARGDAQSGKPQNGKPGDQTGNEIVESAYYNFPWTVVLRYSGSSTAKKVSYRVRVGKFNIANNATKLKNMIKSKTGFDCFTEKHGLETWVYCGSFSVKTNANKRVN